MKTVLLLCFLLIGTIGNAQSIKLGDLTNFLTKSSLAEIDKTLKAKGWMYYNIETTKVEGVMTKVWTYKLNPKTSKAVAWMSISYKDDAPLEALYEIFDYTLTMPFSSSTYEYGFKFEHIEQNDNEFKKRYSTSKFYLYEYQAKEYEKGYQFNLVLKGSVLDGRNGKKKSYYDNGQVKTEYEMKDGELNGIQTSYHENGNLKKEGNWKNDKEDGVFKFYNENGQLESDETYVNGELNGPAHFYYDNGNMEYSCVYSYGKKTGLAEKYNEKGELFSKTNYLLDKRFGDYTEYVKGKESFKASYSGDVLYGSFTENLYNSEDEHYATVTGRYKDGYLDGKVIGKYLNGDTLSVRQYKDQKPMGEWRYYDKDKKMSKRMTFVNGSASVSEYFEDGKVVDRIELKNTTEDYWFFQYDYTAGKSKVTVNYRVPRYELEPNYNEFSAFESETGIFELESTLETPYKYGYYAYENDVLIFSGNYDENNEKSGQWERYFKSQKIKSVLLYSAGEISKEEFFNKKGKPFSGKVVYEMVGTHFTITVKDGLRNGPTIEKDLETKKEEIYNYVNGESVN